LVKSNSHLIKPFLMSLTSHIISFVLKLICNILLKFHQRRADRSFKDLFPSFSSCIYLTKNQNLPLLSSSSLTCVPPSFHHYPFHFCSQIKHAMLFPYIFIQTMCISSLEDPSPSIFINSRAFSPFVTLGVFPNWS